MYIYTNIHTHTHIDNNRREKTTLDVYGQGGQTVSWIFMINILSLFKVFNFEDDNSSQNLKIFSL